MTISKLIFKPVIFFTLLILFNSGYAGENGVIIVNKKVTKEAITKSEIQKIYLGKVALWNNDLKIRACIMTEKTEVGKKFFGTVLNMSAKKYKKHWIRQVFSGYGASPNVFGTAEEVIDYVSKNEGGIGFIPETKAKALKNCKVIKLDSKATF